MEKKPVTAESLERQIYILEKKVVNMVASGYSIKSIFALNGKIQNLKNQLRYMKDFQYLAK